MPPQPRDPPPDSATEHAATYIVALVFTDSGHLRTTLVVTPFGPVTSITKEAIIGNRPRGSSAPVTSSART
jgi:hypothetical protein